ncbi:branched-chain amino acid ABC transporter ATP-binding protein/permease [Rhodopila globiformis]|uniref:Branched-chain amino acid ABC transporter permease/ATP-binding protein n=1 Tax=Rhodopila globiformis TaxID=1071 RepID=A0A2S6MXM7_RHOGL|nr:branched-chain amino acid ABC transporter ATP-binding protein/permease [Rhodopila globiformis]PPQ27099.1 branched-chain amino acid ABC transporter permease/ATP-binding protein [Rhodopila globiformis]
MRRIPLLPEIALAAVLIVLPFLLPHVGGSLDMAQRVLDWGILGLGFDLLFGWTGLLSFGQAAFYGTGGFVAAWLLVNNVLGSVWVALALGTIAAGLFGIVVGWLAVRRIGIYFAMITLAFGQMAYFLENSPLSAYTGGENGLPGVPVPRLGWGASAIALSPGLPLYGVLAAFFFVGFLLARRITRSPFGVILRAIKENTPRAAMLGHAVPRYKLAAFVIAALYAGLAGGLLGVLQSYMPPDAFALDTSGQLVVQTVIGGVGTLIGPMLGAALWLWLRDNLQSIPGIGALWKLILGLIFIGLVIALRRGIAGEIRHRWRHRPIGADTVQPGPAAVAAAPGLPLFAPLVRAAPAVPALEARALSKRYGGLRAVEDVSFAIRPNSIHAVIGPNGAGKSTLFKMLLDEVHPTTGDVHLFGRRVTGLGPCRAAQLGIGKSNQLNTLFPDLTPRESLRIAALARRRGAFRLDLMRRADGIAAVERQVAATLAVVELEARAEVPAHSLAYGEKRRLEIGMALATGPTVLLLDEPLAGMSPTERTATRSLIRTIGRDRTLVIIEHDMDAVFELAERVTVLYDGRLLADGTPEQIQQSQAVQDAYLGGMRERHEPARG